MLRATSEGRKLELALRSSQSFDPLYLELLVRCVSSSVKAVLFELGYKFDLEFLIDTALREKKPLFVALHVLSANDERATLARIYIDTLGFAKADVAPSPVPPYYSFHVYGKKAALCIAEALSQKHVATINIEGAIALANGFAWNQKIIIQLSESELFLVIALLKGRIHQLHFPGHGEKHDKLLEIERQSHHYFVRLVQRGRPPVSVPLYPADAMNLMALLFKQTKINHPHLSDRQVDILIDQYLRMTPVTHE